MPRSFLSRESPEMENKQGKIVLGPKDLGVTLYCRKQFDETDTETIHWNWVYKHY